MGTGQQAISERCYTPFWSPLQASIESISLLPPPSENKIVLPTHHGITSHGSPHLFSTLSPPPPLLLPPSQLPSRSPSSGVALPPHPPLASRLSSHGSRWTTPPFVPVSCLSSHIVSLHELDVTYRHPNDVARWGASRFSVESDWATT